MAKLKGLSLFANVGIAEAYMKDIGVDIKIANEIDVDRARFYQDVYPEAHIYVQPIFPINEEKAAKRGYSVTNEKIRQINEYIFSFAEEKLLSLTPLHRWHIQTPTKNVEIYHYNYLLTLLFPNLLHAQTEERTQSS